MTPRVWIGCLACYNDGSLVGEWFDAADCPTEMDAFNAKVPLVGEYHVVDAHEELWVMDMDEFGGFLTKECSPDHAQRIGLMIAEIESDGFDPELVAIWAKEIAGLDLATFGWERGAFSESYKGGYESLKDFAEQLYGELHEGALAALPSEVRRAIDWEVVAEELGQQYTEVRAGGTVHVFDSAC